MNNAYKQAPELCFTRAKLKSSNGSSYFGWEPELWKYVNKELSGKEGNCIKLINILLGTAEGFKVSQKWVCEMAGLSKDGYYKARKKLEEKKMLIYDEKANTITIDTKGMLDKYSPKEEKNEGMLETYSKSISETYPESIHEKYPEGISEAYHNKKEQKENKEKETEKKESFSAIAEKSSGNPSQAKVSHQPIAITNKDSNPPVQRVTAEQRDKIMTQGLRDFVKELEEINGLSGKTYDLSLENKFVF